jgi:uncharacterized protein (UPF0332 family)
MFHAARAVLLRETGSAPKKHGSVVGQFGLLTKDRSEALRRASADLNWIEERRILADYSDTVRMTTEDAVGALRKAQAFLDLCAREFGFPREEQIGNG